MTQVAGLKIRKGVFREVFQKKNSGAHQFGDLCT